MLADIFINKNLNLINKNKISIILMYLFYNINFNKDHLIHLRIHI